VVSTWTIPGAQERRQKHVAKKEPNAAHFLGALVVAGLSGGLTASWTVFWIALASLLTAACVAGDIRR